jgi:hypothetical protein
MIIAASHIILDLLVETLGHVSKNKYFELRRGGINVCKAEQLMEVLLC